MPAPHHLSRYCDSLTAVAAADPSRCASQPVAGQNVAAGDVQELHDAARHITWHTDGENYWTAERQRRAC